MSDASDRPPDPSELEPTLAETEFAQSAADEARQIGPYRLLQKIGEGGMGEVWEAEQSEPVRRKVALKLIKAGMDSQQIVARFEAERQALAMMSHPNIARVFDAGTTRLGRPYFAMEYVEGEPIHQYCDRHRLPARQRLDLFCHVCEGVQHAHQKGIIHRDIKPSNVLVVTQDGRPVPKVIDFGLAKATEQKLTESTLHTQLGMMLGTPEYMSPEQAEISGLDVDTRTDVYSLGVMLYELLVGALPFASKELRGVSFDELRRLIREVEPSTPSAKLRSLGEVSQESAQKRRTDPVSLWRQLRGDLDCIVMMAMEKDRTRRYASPSELAADVRRYLTDQPVVARPPSSAYRTRKFVRRHRVGVAAASLVVLALMGGAVVSTWQYFRAEFARRDAEDRAYRASLAAAAAAHERNDPRTVRRHLDSVPEKLRGWEWEYLLHDSDRSLSTPLTLPRKESGYVMGLSPDGALVAARPAVGGFDPIEVHDLSTGAKLYELPTWESQATHFTFSADNRYLAYSAWGRPSVQIWDLRSGTPLVPPEAVKNYHRFLGFHPDGVRAAVADGAGAILVIGLAPRRTLSKIDSVWKQTPLRGEFSPDGRWLAIGPAADFDDPVRLFDVASSALVHEFGDVRDRTSIRFNADGSRIALLTRQGPIRAFDTSSWEPVGTWQRGETWFGDLCFVEEEDSDVIVAGGADGILRFLRFGSTRPRSLLRGESLGEQSIAWDRERDQVVTAHGSGVVHRWPRRRPWIASISAGRATLQFAGPGRALLGTLGSASDPRQVGVWSVSEGRDLAWLRQYPVSMSHGSRVTDLALSPDGLRLAVANASGWRQGRFKIYDLQTGHNNFSPSLIWGHDPHAIDWSPDGSRIALAGDNGLARIYETKNLAAYQPLSGHEGTVHEVRFTHDGARVVTAGRDGALRVWDLSGRELRLINVGEAITSFSLLGGGRLVAAGTVTGEIRILRLDDGSEISRLTEHSERVDALALSPGGERLVSGSADRSVVFWDTQTWKSVLTLRWENPIRALAFEPEGRRLAVADGAGTVRFLDPVAEAERDAERDLAVEARRLAASVVAELLAVDPDLAGGHQRVRASAALSGLAREAAIDELYAAAEKQLAAAYVKDANFQAAYPHVARQILRNLLVTPASDRDWPEFDEAAAAVRADASLSPAERDAVAEMAEALRYYHFSDPELTGEGVWTDVVILQTAAKPEPAEPHDHALALFAAEALQEALPNNQRFATTLGYAQYRMALHEDAERTLERAVEQAGPGEPDAETWAFLSMTRARLGSTQRSGEALRRCDAAVAAGRIRREETAGALCDEARALLARPAAQRVRRSIERASLDRLAEQLDVGNPSRGYAVRSLAERDLAHGRLGRAERLQRRGLETALRDVGPQSMELVWRQQELALLLDKTGKHEEAEALLRDALRIARAILGDDKNEIATCHARIGRSLMAQKRFAEAEAEFRQSLALHEKNVGPLHWHTTSLKNLLGWAVASQRRYEEAEALFLEAHGTEDPSPDGRRMRDAARDRLVELYQDWGKAEKAAEWRKPPPS